MSLHRLVDSGINLIGSCLPHVIGAYTVVNNILCLGKKSVDHVVLHYCTFFNVVVFASVYK